MKSIWIAKYDDNEIRVENSWFKGEKLFVNNELQDDRLSFISANLTGQLKNSNGEKLNIKVNISGFFTVGCRLFVDNKPLNLIQTK
jgi:hypothetical protein